MNGLLLATALFTATGCATFPKADYAVYRHPQTGDILACEAGGDVYGSALYAACKTAAERAGYVREGTVQRDRSAQYGTDYARPRPLPVE